MTADPNEAAPVSDFDIDRSTSQAWASFTAKLADVLSVMEDDATLTIGAMAGEHSGQPPFVAFRAAPDGGLIAEASGNLQLGEYFQLTDGQAAAMVENGWLPPTADGPSPSDRFHLAATQEEAQQVAEKAVRALRDVFGVPHPAFLAPDQLAEILTPPAVEELPAAVEPVFAADEVVAVMPRSRVHLDQLVAAELARMLGHDPVRDDQGDYAIRVGSTMVFVRTSPDWREILVFSAIVHDVEGRSRAMEVLSDLNTDARFVRFLLIRDRVFVSLSVYAQPFVPAHLRQALGLVSVTGDALDEDLATKLRGRTTFTDDGTASGPADPPD